MKRSCAVSLARRGSMAALLLALPLIGAASAGAEPRPGRAAQGAPVPDVEGVAFELGASPDPAVVADAVSLVGELPFAAPSKAGGPAILIRHLGKGRVIRFDPYADGPAEGDAQGERDPDPGTTSEMVAFNARSGQEFLISTSTEYLTELAAAAERRGMNREYEPTAPPGRTLTELGLSGLLTDPGIGARPNSWSNGFDDRFRAYGQDAPVTNSLHKRLVQLGGGCSGTLVGPRHVLTAGHCLWSRQNQAWSDDFVVAAGRNGTSSTTSVLVDNDNIPGGQVLWYFTPASFRDPNNTSTGPVDFGILTIPARLGSTVGWLGWWTLTDGTLSAQTIRRAGHPLCVATDNNGNARIDEPSPCSPNHLYVNLNPCGLGEFGGAKDGWNRRVSHSCDASAADSGSGLYVNYNNEGNGVVAVHTTSLCGSTAVQAACAGVEISRPLRATRITPEHAGWISYFRDKYP